MKIHNMMGNKIIFDEQPDEGDIIINDDDVLTVYEDGHLGLRSRCVLENWGNMPQHAACITAALEGAGIDDFECQQLDDYDATLADFEAMTGRGL